MTDIGFFEGLFSLLGGAIDYLWAVLGPPVMVIIIILIICGVGMAIYEIIQYIKELGERVTALEAKEANEEVVEPVESICEDCGRRFESELGLKRHRAWSRKLGECRVW